MTRTCDYCRRSYSRPPSLIGKFCSKDCAYAARYKPNAERRHRRIRYAPNHPLAATAGYVSEARAVLYDKIGPGPHTCHWCSAPIEWMVGRIGNARGALIADHLNGDAHDDAPTNLVPACGPCNGTRTQVVRDDEDYVVRANGTRLRGDRRTCELCGASFVTFGKQPPGRGRFCSRSCARKVPRKRAQGSSVVVTASP